VRLVNDLEVPEVTLYVAMKVACSPAWNFESRPEPEVPAEVVVVELAAAVVVVVVELVAAEVVDVVELADVVVVVEGVLEPLQPAATIAATVTRAKPAATRLGLIFLAILIVYASRISGPLLQTTAECRGDGCRDRFKCVVRLTHSRIPW
jgi:hypothetical protein